MTFPPSGRPREGRPTAQGRVVEALPNAMFAVELTNGDRILCRISGDLATRGMRLVPGDRVTVELSPYDLSRGSIIQRHG